MVVVGGTSSSELSVYHGVPQGSVLGTLLFPPLVKDLSNWIKRYYMWTTTTLMMGGATVGDIERAALEDLAVRSTGSGTTDFSVEH